jgi:hypothetical protein
MNVPWSRHIFRIEDVRLFYRPLVGIPERKRPLGRPRRGRKNNIKLDNVKTVYGSDEISVPQHRYHSAVLDTAVNRPVA